MSVYIQRLDKPLIKPRLVFRTSAPCDIPARTSPAFPLNWFLSLSLPRVYPHQSFPFVESLVCIGVGLFVGSLSLWRPLLPSSNTSHAGTAFSPLPPSLGSSLSWLPASLLITGSESPCLTSSCFHHCLVTPWAPVRASSLWLDPFPEWPHSLSPTSPMLSVLTTPLPNPYLLEELPPVL